MKEVTRAKTEGLDWTVGQGPSVQEDTPIKVCRPFSSVERGPPESPLQMDLPGLEAQIMLSDMSKDTAPQSALALATTSISCRVDARSPKGAVNPQPTATEAEPL